MGLNMDNPHVETGDKGNALQDWRVQGATAENTDRGRLYLRKQGTDLQLFRDQGFANLVAQGPDANEADVVLSPQNSSGLTVTVWRTSGNVSDGTTIPFVTLYVWLLSELDLRENADDIEGALLKNEVNFAVPLKQTMREFLTRLASIYPPPPGVGHPLRWAPPTVEQGSKGEQEYTAQFFWTLNRRGQWEVTGLQNPGDYREWAIQQTLSKIFRRKARAHTEADPWWTRHLAAEQEADRLWRTIKPWVDVDQDAMPDRIPVTRSLRVRRG